uniref:eIF-4F 25 kDa subunit n=1 Tax=Drosophila melanogaster TaxID=7227 RepID=A0AN96_DROME|nr:CG8277 [Drosophila melanogaster]
MASAQVQSFDIMKQQDQQHQLNSIHKHHHHHEGVPLESISPEPIDEEIYQVEYKHPLEHVWTLWYLENDRTKHWRDMLNEITEIDSVETFWSLYHTIKTPAELKIGCDYSVFKKGIKPMWEDEANIKGGRWLVTVSKSAKAELDQIWLDILLLMVGQNFEYSDEICGAVINIRNKSNKISVWTANGSNEMAILEIGQKLKILLHLQSHSLQYQLHSDAMSKFNSGVKSVYTL